MHDIDPLSANFWIEVGLAVLCGAVLGLDREIRRKPMGFRTSILICLGAAMFVKLGLDLTEHTGDPSRVLGQVVAGVGFFGAGVIFTRKSSVRGVTTASTVWILAAVGALVGASEWGAALGVTFVSLMVLVVFDLLEDWIVRPLQREPKPGDEEPGEED
jgi:putative Mg2+ transporter-C (MgtC) family protein